MATIQDLSDTDLYSRWEWERVQDEHLPNEVLVASLEHEARRRGFNLKDVVYSLGITAARIFDPDLHPRGLDGRFIEKLGIIELFGLGGNMKDGRRGQVVDITPDSKSPGRPTIKVRIDDPNTGRPQMFVDVKPENVKQAPKAKAHLPDEKGRPDVGLPSGAGSKDDPIRTANVDEAAQALGEGKYVELDQPSTASVLLDKIRELTDDAKLKGEDAPTYDLCLASVAGTNLFCAETKNIPRIRMPQLKTNKPEPGTLAATLPLDDRGEADGAGLFVDYLRGRGIDVTEDVVPADTLRPSQNELNGANVAGIMSFIEGGGTLDGKIFITSDDYVVDGHHRWAAQVGAGIINEDDLDIAVDRIDMPILQVLAIGNNWTTSNGFPHADVGPNLKEADTPDTETPDMNAPDLPRNAPSRYDGLGSVEAIDAKLDEDLAAQDRLGGTSSTDFVHRQVLREDAVEAKSRLSDGLTDEDELIGMKLETSTDLSEELVTDRFSELEIRAQELDALDDGHVAEALADVQYQLSNEDILAADAALDDVETALAKFEDENVSDEFGNTPEGDAAELEALRQHDVAEPDVPSEQPAPEGGEQVDEIPADFDETQDHRWVLPDGSWVDYDQTDSTFTLYNGDNEFQGASMSEDDLRYELNPPASAPMAGPDEPSQPVANRDDWQRGVDNARDTIADEESVPEELLRELDESDGDWDADFSGAPISDSDSFKQGVRDYADWELAGPEDEEANYEDPIVTELKDAIEADLDDGVDPDDITEASLQPIVDDLKSRGASESEIDEAMSVLFPDGQLLDAVDREKLGGTPEGEPIGEPDDGTIPPDQDPTADVPTTPGRMDGEVGGNWDDEDSMMIDVGNDVRERTGDDTLDVTAPSGGSGEIIDENENTVGTYRVLDREDGGFENVDWEMNPPPTTNRTQEPSSYSQSALSNDQIADDISTQFDRLSADNPELTADYTDDIALLTEAVRDANDPNNPNAEEDSSARLAELQDLIDEVMNDDRVDPNALALEQELIRERDPNYETDSVGPAPIEGEPVGAPEGDLPAVADMSDEDLADERGRYLASDKTLKGAEWDRYQEVQSEFGRRADAPEEDVTDAPRGATDVAPLAEGEVQADVDVRNMSGDVDPIDIEGVSEAEKAKPKKAKGTKYVVMHDGELQMATVSSQGKKTMADVADRDYMEITPDMIVGKVTKKEAPSGDAPVSELDTPDTPLSESNDVDRLVNVWQNDWDQVARTTTGPSQSDAAFERLSELGMLTEPDESEGGRQVLSPAGLERQKADQLARAPGDGGGSVAEKMSEAGASIEGDQVVGAPGDYQGSAVKLLDGGDSPIGTRVKSAKDGKVGEVVGYDKSDGYVKVKYDGDPKTYARSKRTLLTENNLGQTSLEEPGLGTGPPPTAELAELKGENLTDQQLLDEIDRHNKMADRPGGLTVPEGKRRGALVIESNARKVTAVGEKERADAAKAAPAAPSKPKSWGDPVIQKQLKETEQMFREEGVQYSVPDLLDTRRDQVGDEIAYARANGQDSITLKPPSGVEQDIPLELAEAWAAANGVKVPAAPLA